MPVYIGILYHTIVFSFWKEEAEKKMLRAEKNWQRLNIFARGRNRLMNKRGHYRMKTGAALIVDDWVNNNWPEEAKEAACNFIRDFRAIAFCTSETGPTFTPIDAKNCQIMVDYYRSRKCYLVYNAAIHIYLSKKEQIKITFGKRVTERLAQPISQDSISCVYQEIRGDGKDQVELVLIVGENAIEKLFQSYKTLIVPDANQIPKGKTCIYADAGGEIQRIKSMQ